MPKKTATIDPKPRYSELLDSFINDKRFTGADETEKDRLLNRFFDRVTAGHIQSQGFDPKDHRDQFISKYAPKKKDFSTESLESSEDLSNGSEQDEVLANKAEARLDEQRLKEKDAIGTSDDPTLKTAIERGSLGSGIGGDLQELTSGILTGRKRDNQIITGFNTNVPIKNLKFTKEDQERLISSIQEKSKRLESLPESAIAPVLQEITEDDSLNGIQKIGKAFAAIFAQGNPIENLGHLNSESIASGPEGLIFGLTGALVGGVTGAAVGSALGSFSAESRNAMSNGFSKAGVDISDPESLRKALGNPELLREIKKNANLRGAAVAGVDMLFALMVPFVGKTSLSPIKKLISGFILESLGEGFGEFAGQKAAGEKFDPVGIATEVASSVGQSLATTSVGLSKDLAVQKVKKIAKKRISESPEDIIKSVEQPLKPSNESDTKSESSTKTDVKETKPTGKKSKKGSTDNKAAGGKGEGVVGSDTKTKTVETKKTPKSKKTGKSTPDTKKGTTPKTKSTTKVGKNDYSVENTDTGLKVVNETTGKEINRKSKAYDKVVQEYKDNNIEAWREGKEYTPKSVDEVTNEVEYDQKVIERSENPAQVANSWQNTADEAISPIQQAIKENLKPMTIDALRRSGKQIMEGKMQIQAAFFGKKNNPNTTPMDVQIEEQWAKDLGITEQDIFEFMQDHPNGVKSAKPELGLKDQLAQKFEQLTGVEIDETLANKINPPVTESANTADVPFQTRKQYAEAGKSQVKVGRIQPAPVTRKPGSSVKPIRKIVSDLNRTLKKATLFRSKKGKGKGVLGWYNPASGAIGVRNLQDLDVLAHEYGHSLDDLYGIYNKIPETKKRTIIAEVAPFAKYGSKPPPKSLSRKEKADYILGEGIAEYIRARIINPQEAISQAPEFSKWFDSRLSARAKRSFDSFSNDVRTFVGLPDSEKTMANIEMVWDKDKVSAFNKVMDEISEIINPDKDYFRATWWDKFQVSYINSDAVLNKVSRWLENKKGVKLLQKNDPRKLINLLNGFNATFKNILEEGMVTGNFNRILDGDKAVNIEYLLEKYDNTTEEGMKKEIKLSLAWMVSKRAIEMNDKAIKAQLKEDIEAGYQAPYELLKLFPDIEAFENKHNPHKTAKSLDRYLSPKTLTGAGAGIIADIDIARGVLREMADMDAGKKARLEETARRYKFLSDSVLDFMMDKGRISSDQVKFIKENNLEYVAMQRIVETKPGESIQVFEKSTSGDRLATVKTVIYKQKGSMLTIKDPYGSLIETMAKGMKEANRNEAMLAFRDLWSSERKMGEGDVVELGQIAEKVDVAGDGVITIFDKGVPEHWAINDNDFLESLKIVDFAASEVPWILQQYAKYVRFTVTTAPKFAVANKIRDELTRLIVSTSVGFRFGTGHGILFNKKQRADITNQYELVGGSQSGYHLLDEHFYRKTLEDGIRKLSKDKNTLLINVTESPGKAWKKYKQLIEFSETSTRLEEYKTTFKKGKEEGLTDYDAMIEAGFQARGLLDFAVMGRNIRAWNKVSPFLNAGIQGVAKEIRSVKERPVQTVSKWLAVQVLPTMILRHLIHEMGPEAEKEFEELPSWRRDLFWNIRIAPDFWISLPRGFLMSATASGVERLMSKYVYDQENAMDGYTGSLLRSLVPVDQGAAVGPFKPIIEIATNHDFFEGGDIISKFEEDELLESRAGTVRASRLGKLIGKIGVDPRFVDHFIESMFTYWGKAATKISNIGREDTTKKMGWREFALLVKRTPAYDSKSVQWVIKQAKLNGLQSQRFIKKNFAGYVSGYFDAESSKEKEKRARELVEFARDIRKIWTELDIENKETPFSEEKIKNIKRETKKRFRK